MAKQMALGKRGDSTIGQPKMSTIGGGGKRDHHATGKEGINNVNCRGSKTFRDGKEGIGIVNPEDETERGQTDVGQTCTGEGKKRPLSEKRRQSKEPSLRRRRRIRLKKKKSNPKGIGLERDGGGLLRKRRRAL